MSDAWIRAGRGAVIFVGLVVAAISYTHIRDLALAYGGDSLTAPLLPLGIDGAVAAFTVFMHQAQGLPLWLSRFGLLVAIGMTVAFNTAYGAAFGVTGAVVWSSPAVLLVICIEVSVLTVRKTLPAAAVPVVAEPVKPQIVPDEVTAAFVRGREVPIAVSPGKLTVADPELFTLSAKELAVKRRVSQSTVQRTRRLAKGDMVTAGTNGKAH